MKGMDELRKVIDDISQLEEFKELTKMFSDNFFIQGEETEDLAEALQRAPESLVDMIGDELEIEGFEDQTRQEKEETLYQAIQDDFDEEFMFMSESEMVAFVKTMNGYELSDMEMLAVTEIYNNRGWTFSFIQDDGVIVVVMDQLRDIFKSKMEDEEAQGMLGLTIAVRRCALTSINLYGVVEKHQFNKMLWSLMAKKSNAELPEKEEESLKEITEQVLEMIEERSDAFWIDEDYIVSTDFEDRGDYRSFLKTLRYKEYYMPGEKEIELYQSEQVDRNNRYYKKILSNLKSILKDSRRADNLMFELEYRAVQEDITTSEILTLLDERDILFPTQKLGMIFSENCLNWLNAIRRWSNRGFTNEELGICNTSKMDDHVFREYAQPVGKSKIGRNDTCPCGSGKKYKRSCLDKE